MKYFPLFANLKDSPCLVVGGGAVALRKIRLLRKANARVTVVAPALHDDVQSMVDDKLIDYLPEKYGPHHLDGQLLVVAATNFPGVNAQVFAHAKERNMLCNSVDDPEHSSFITPAIVDRSPLVIAISSGGAAPVLARLLREKFEREIPQQMALLAKSAAQWRDRVKVALGSLTARRRFWEALFERFVTDVDRTPGRLDKEVATMLEQHARQEDARRGEAWLIGAGPGDPALLTIRAQQLLQRADVVLYDRLVSQEILDMARRDADFINVGKPLAGTGCASLVQEYTIELLLKYVGQGLRVARLKGGDPFIFGRGGEEITALKEADMDYQIVPGITAAAACAAYAGIPLTHRDHSQSVVFLTGHGKNSEDNLDWASLARDRQTLAVYMGVSQFASLSRNLRLHGRSAQTPFAIIERGTTPEQRVVMGTLDNLATVATHNQVKAPALLIIGDVASYAQTQQWFNISTQSESPLAAKQKFA